MANVAINGLGRIGRATIKIILDTPGLDLVAVNDIAAVDNLAYLLEYDTAYGRFHHPVDHDETSLKVAGKSIRVLNEKDPGRLPWGEMGVDLVFECTGIFRTEDQIRQHIAAGAKHVILSAPPKGGEVPMVVHGVNSTEGQALRSCASCTTNCIAPVVEIVGRRIGTRKAMMTTVHAYTSSQAIVDAPASKWRRGRAGGVNLVPTSTGAAKATTKVLPQYAGRFDGMAIRAPVAIGSIADMTFVTERATSVDEVIQIFREESDSERYKGIVTIAQAPIVSADVAQDPSASIVDPSLVQVVDGDLLKVMAWYDNEWGYAAQMVREGRHVLS